MDIQKQLSDFKGRVDEEIGTYLDEVIEKAKKEDIFLAELLNRVKKFVLAGGKRLRGALLYSGYSVSGGTDKKEIIKVCAGIELVHSFFLVHDDIMDRDDTRHNVDTLHREFAKVGKRFFPDKDSDHFGVSMAITAGDLLGSMGSQRIFSSHFPADRIVAALIQLQGSISRTGMGQAMDIYMEYQKQATEEQVLAMYINKTARYTFECPLHIGGILAGASQEVLEAFSRYALPLGIAFQLQDDILGMYGESGKTGKSVGSDIAEGKMTLLVVKALELSSTEEQKEIQALLGKKEGVTEKELERVRDIVSESGSLDFIKARIEKYLEEGCAVAQAFPGDSPEAKEFLVGIAEYLKGREV